MVVYTLEQRWAKWTCDRLTEDADFGKKNHLFRWISFWSWRICRQSKIVAFGAQKTRTHTLKSRRTQSESLFGADLGPEHNSAIFLRKWAGRGRYGDRYWAMLNEFLFTKIEEEDIGNIWFEQDIATCHTAGATLDVLRPAFEDHIISRSADVVWPPRSCDLTPLDYYLWGAV